jgi:hypothetical protein
MRRTVCQRRKNGFGIVAPETVYTSEREDDTCHSASRSRYGDRSSKPGP